MTKKTAAGDETISVLEITEGRLEFCVVGKEPHIANRMPEKAMRQILFPHKKNAAEKQSSLKHDPLEEYRASPYRLIDDAAATLLGIKGAAFKGAMRSAALDMPGAKKAQIGRLTYVEGDLVPLYGVPQLLMTVVRSADMNRTPDVRTRAILKEWACRVTVRFVKPILREQVVANLFAAAGICIGVGDWRPEKGAGNFGQFRLASPDDPEFLQIVNTGGRDAQIAAMKDPEPYDDESAELLSWYDTEVTRRGFRSVRSQEVAS